MDERVAVLVDGDNVSPVYSPDILTIARRHGATDVVRVYGNACVNSDWHSVVQYRFIHSGTGKNATDILMAIDAVELALTGNIKTFVIASSDGDFLHLVQRLREVGCRVIGAGEAKAPETFRAACSEFRQFGPERPEPRPCAVAPQDTAIDQMDLNIRKTIANNSKNGEGMKIALLSTLMKRQFDTKISAYPERTWRAYLSKRRDLYDLDPRGPEARVRFRKEGFAPV